MSIAYDYQKRNVELDEFITPPQLIQKTVDLALKYFSPYSSTLRVLDPGCNLGQWGPHIRTAIPLCEITGVELMDVPQNQSYSEWIPNQDFLSWVPAEPFPLIMGNPPYSDRRSGKSVVVCNSWVKHALDLLSPEGHLFFILRKGFNHNVRVWKQVLLENPPIYEYLLLPRPNFYGEHDTRTDGSSGAQWDYSIFEWQKGFKGNMQSIPYFWKEQDETA